ncbi:MAG TPA: large conductance mechanosensitive channel protein MscL [Polyangiaceae bacterium]|nr:large conductance mechanosensitive channel protein MscL [Polyangiaceae bacterium]
MIKEFKEFAIKGNVVDMAVGIIIGAAFTTVVKTLVDEVIMPPIGLLTGGVDFSSKFLMLKDGVVSAAPYTSLADAKKAGAVVLAYGNFINTVVSFLIVALVLFFIVRWINKLRRQDPAPTPNTKQCPFCRSQIDREASRCMHCTSELGKAAAAV